MSNKRPDMAGFRKKALSDPDVRAEYNALENKFQREREAIKLSKPKASAIEK